MRITMVARPPSDANLTLLRQLGVDDAVHYDMAGLPDDRAELKAIAERYARFGLRWTIAESGPAIDRIVLGKEGWRAQLDAYCRIVRHLGDLGVEVIAYNFMPQVSADAMVIRTAFDRPTRGGALTSGFRLADITDATMPHAEHPISRAAMWGNLERFLEAVLPVAEASGVRLAMHPDDPPMPRLCRLERIMGSVADFDRLLAYSSSPANALTFCFGCFAERGEDLPALIAHFGSRIAFVHVRDIAGTEDDFIETFPDDGDNDMAAAFRALHEIGYGGPLRSDHAPLTALDAEHAHDGYQMTGHVFAIGYLRGLAQATAAPRHSFHNAERHA